MVFDFLFKDTQSSHCLQILITKFFPFELLDLQFSVSV